MSSNQFTQTQINTLATSLPSQGGTFDILTQTTFLSTPPTVTSGWTIPQKTTFIVLQSDDLIDINNINFEIYPRDITLTLTGALFITSFGFPPTTSSTLFIPAGTSVPINNIQSSSSTVKFQISGIPIDIKNLELHGILTYIDVSNLTSLTTLNCKTAFDSANAFMPIIPNTVTDLNMNYNAFNSTQVNALVSALPTRTLSTPSTFRVQYQDSGNALDQIIHSVSVPTYWTVDSIPEPTPPTLGRSSNIRGTSTETGIVLKITIDPLTSDDMITLTGCVEYFSNTTSFNVYTGDSVFFIKLTNNNFSLRFNSILSTDNLTIERNPLVNSFNNSTSVTIDIDSFVNVTEANLSGINLIRFPIFTNIPIVKLDVSNNAITRFDNVFQFIREINAENNRITTIPALNSFFLLTQFLLYGNPLSSYDINTVIKFINVSSLSFSLPYTIPDMINLYPFLTLGNITSLSNHRAVLNDSLRSLDISFAAPYSLSDITEIVLMDVDAILRLNGITDFDSSKFSNNITTLSLTFSSPPTPLDLINLGTDTSSPPNPIPSQVSNLSLNNISTTSLIVSKLPSTLVRLQLSYASPSAMPDLKTTLTNSIKTLYLKNISALDFGKLPSDCIRLTLDSSIFPDLSSFTGLKTLEFINSNITTFDPAKLPSGLENLIINLKRLMKQKRLEN
jgi:hypothetical protein